MSATVLASCSSGGGSGASPSGSTVTATPGETVSLEGKVNDKFSVETINTNPGALTLKLTVPGGTPHNLEVEGVAAAKIPLISGGESRSITMTLKSGTYNFVCTIHTGMDGKIVVADAP